MGSLKISFSAKDFSWGAKRRCNSAAKVPPSVRLCPESFSRGNTSEAEVYAGRGNIGLSIENYLEYLSGIYSILDSFLLPKNLLTQRYDI